MSDRDDLVIEEMEIALARVYRKYRRATAPEKLQLKPELKKAADNWVEAQTTLGEAGEIATEADLRQIRQIRESIDDAAATQDLVIGVGRLAGFMLKFV